MAKRQKMKIMICGSMTFSKQMVQVKKALEKLGHSVSLPYDIEVHLDNPGFINDFEKNHHHAVKNDIMRKCFQLVAENDAILVLNYPKNGVKGYIGTSSLMEIGLAHYLGKKIFLLNEIPPATKARWAHEVRIIQPLVIDGDFEKIR